MEKHISSEREYTCFSLRNGLCVVLVRDLETRISGATMVVSGGAFSDPPNCPGLNHLMEHMLFLGSEAYPVAKEFSEFIYLNGGEEKAYTEMEYSVFGFTVSNKSFRTAFEMFGEFFNRPLFNINSIEGEVIAIENEFQLQSQNDLLRLEHLKGCTANVGHPYNCFGWGNKASFKPHTPSHLRKLLLNLVNDRFVGGSMNLVVCGRDPFESLQQMVIDCFSRIRYGPKLNREGNYPGPHIWPAEKIVRCNSLGELDLLDISWSLPPKAYSQYKPEVYLQRVLEQRGKGTLFSLLKKRELVNSFKVLIGNVNDDGGALDSTSYGSRFTIRMNLSTHGTQKIYDIVELVLAFLKCLRNEHFPLVMEEYKIFQSIKYENFDTSEDGANIANFTNFLAVNMLCFPLEKAISGVFEVDSDSEDSIAAFLSFLCPSNMNLYLLSKSFFKESDAKTDPWFNIIYKQEDIPSFWKVRWHENLNFPGFQPPRVNPYLPRPEPLEDGDHSIEMDVQPGGDDFDYLEDEDHPIEINCSTTLKHQQSAGPATVNFSVRLNIKPNEESKAFGLLFQYFLTDSLDCISHQAHQAGFETSLVFDAYKINFSVIGIFNEKMPVLVEHIWKGFLSFLPSPKTFQHQKEAFISNFKKSAIDIECQSIMILEQSFVKTSLGFHSTLHSLKRVNCEDLTNFSISLRSKMLIDVISFGDITLKDARKISRVFIAVPLPKNVIAIEEPFELEAASSMTGTNSLVKVMYQIGCTPNPMHTSYLQVLSKMIKEHTFSILRIKERLGYSVSSYLLCLGGVDHFVIQVTSSSYDSAFLKEKILSYANSLDKYLETISPSSFENYKKMVREDLSTGGTSLWESIVENRGSDKFYDAVYVNVFKMKQADLMKFYLEYIQAASKRVVVSIDPKKA